MDDQEVNGKPLLEVIELEESRPVPAKKIAVTILGTGDFGKALAKRLSLVGYDVVIGSRSPGKRGTSEDYRVLSTEDAVNHSDVIFFAIPRDGFDKMAALLKTQVDNKIVVDVSNRTQASSEGPSNTEYLASLLPGARVVKGFNVISAWTLENDIAGHGSRLVYVCGDDPEAKRQVMDLARALLFTPVDQGSLKMAKSIEAKPLELFPSWRVALMMLTVLYLIFALYFIINTALTSGDYTHYPLRMFSITNAFSALGLLDMVYLPGCIAALLQLAYGTKYRRFPRWLDLWMKSRKQLGLMALALAGLHGCMTTLYWSPHYSSYFYQQSSVTIGNVTLVEYKQMVVRGEAFLALGVLAFASLCILGITSLPTVLNRMSWREWNFVQSGLGYFAFVSALAHYSVLAFPVNPDFPKFTAIRVLYPTVLVVLIGYLTVFLHLILLTPCLANQVKKIRNGWERGNVTV